MVKDDNWSYHGDFMMYINADSLCCTPENNMFVDYNLNTKDDTKLWQGYGKTDLSYIAGRM